MNVLTYKTNIVFVTYVFICIPAMDTWTYIQENFIIESGGL